MHNYFEAESNAIVANLHVQASTAQRAVEMAMPLLEAAMTRKHVGESGFLHIVIMKPGSCAYTDKFEDAILYEHSIGNRANWDADYQAFARAKALLHWRTGMDTHTVQTAYPHLLQHGDTHLWGTANVDGILVATSGANLWWDEAFSGIVACCLKALAKESALTSA